MKDDNGMTYMQRVADYAWTYDLNRGDIRINEQVALGKTNREIAEDFHCSEENIERRIKKICQILGVKNRVQMAVKFVEACYPREGKQSA